MESSCTKDGMDTPPARCPLRAASPAHDVTAVTLSSPLGGGLRVLLSPLTANAAVGCCVL
eukprot:1192526-Prorocentrum_minimum.AAC.3